MESLFVKVTPSTLLTHVSCTDLESRLYKATRFLLTSSSDQVTSTPEGLKLAWHHFQEAIIQIGQIVSAQNGRIEFDEFSQKLVLEYLDDVKQSKQKEKGLNSKVISELLSRGGIKRKLTKPQLRDLQQLLSLKHGANFSVPGAGKTATLLSLHSILNQQKKVDKLFVISPLNAFISWEDEIRETIKKKLNVVRISAKDMQDGRKLQTNSPDIFLVNYEKLRKGIEELIPIFLINKIHFVLDESHRIKSGWENQSFQQIMALASIAIRRDILSGTPMPQHVNDLDPQFIFLWRTNLIPKLIDNNYEKLIRATNTAISDRFVRTTKKELGLKAPIVKYVNIEMGPIQKEIYSLFKSESARKLSELDPESRVYFRSLGKNVVRLLQAASNPVLLGSEDEYYEELVEIPKGSKIWTLLGEFAKYEKPSKVTYLQNRVREILRKNKDEKVVVWTYFIRNIHLLEKLLAEFNPVSIYGAIPTGDEADEASREARIRRFHNDDQCRVLIANPQACGEGISLHKASHYAIYLDRNFNAAYYLQSIDRIHRLGLSPNQKTTIEVLVSNDSIDEPLAVRLNQKAMAMGKVLNDPHLVQLAYDPIDIPSEDSLGIDSKDILAIRDHLNSPTEN